MNTYDSLQAQLRALTEDEPHWLPNLANVAAAIYESLPNLNWAGFYLMIQGELVLGPFQGRPACIRIPVGRGVCGTCAKTGQTQRVPNVHAFPGHIACDSASNSELVIPLWKGDRLVGVLDLDSPIFDRFSEEDQRGLEACATILSRAIQNFEGA